MCVFVCVREKGGMGKNTGHVRICGFTARMWVELAVGKYRGRSSGKLTLFVDKKGGIENSVI